jgi:hypothetical protein
MVDLADVRPEQAVTQIRAEREGKRPTTQAGKFVREEIEHVRRGKHGVRSTKQAIAIGLSKARRAGVKLGPPPRGRAKAKTRKSAEYALRRADRGTPSPTRSRAIAGALRREGRGAASREALSSQARQAARRRGPAGRKAAARKAVATKGPEARKAAVRKAAETRAAA